MASIESITAGKLLQEFIVGYEDEPFGEQGLVIVKQLIDLAYPGQPLEKILSSSELCEMLTTHASQFNFRRQQYFQSVMSFFIENPPDKLLKMTGTQLKKELTENLSIEKDIPTLEIDRATYDLSGNPESASLARDQLETALINTTASLFGYLLIEDENRSGKFFRDLDNNCRVIATRTLVINSLYIIVREILRFNWRWFSVTGSFPTKKELGVENICQYVYKQPQEYLEKIYSKFLKKLNNEFRSPLDSLISNCKAQAERKESNFKLDIDLEYHQFDKIEAKVIKDLEKLQSRVKSGKKINPKDFDSIKENLSKEYEKVKRDISKEFSNFTKMLDGLLSQEPPWFKYHKKESLWELEPSQVVQNKLNAKLSVKNAFLLQKKSKSLQQAVDIFEQLGGIHFAMENIISHYFYERVPSRLVKLVETPAKRQKIKVLKFLQEKRYSEGLDAVGSFLVPYSNDMISNLLEVGISLFRDSYIKNNPMVLINEEKPKNPKYLELLDIPKEVFDENTPEQLFGDEFFTFQINDNRVKMGVNLKPMNGKGNDLFGLLVSSTALDCAQIYKKATKILGNFSGYVYSTAIGNMQVCPPALRAVDDLFM